MSLDNQTKKILENLTRAVSRIEKTVHGNAFNSLDIVSEHHLPRLSGIEKISLPQKGTDASKHAEDINFVKELIKEFYTYANFHDRSILDLNSALGPKTQKLYKEILKVLTRDFYENPIIEHMRAMRIIELYQTLYKDWEELHKTALPEVKGNIFIPSLYNKIKDRTFNFRDCPKVPSHSFHSALNLQSLNYSVKELHKEIVEHNMFKSYEVPSSLIMFVFSLGDLEDFEEADETNLVSAKEKLTKLRTLIKSFPTEFPSVSEAFSQTWKAFCTHFSYFLKNILHQIESAEKFIARKEQAEKK